MQPPSVVSTLSILDDVPSEVEVPTVTIRKTGPPTIIYRYGQDQVENEELPSPMDTVTPLMSPNSLYVETDDDVASEASSHVIDKIASQIRELENEQYSSPPVGLGLYQTEEPIYVQRTELTPIMEVSDPGSLASEAAEPYIASRIASLDAEMKDQHITPPPTRQSSNSGRSPVSPQSSTHSIDRARTASLTSQAERLRNKFLKKSPPEDDLTIDTGASDPAKIERRMKFENLIRSGETMKMTLTPTTLRSIEVWLFLVEVNGRVTNRGRNNGHCLNAFDSK
jgi:hypothetical protein